MMFKNRILRIISILVLVALVISGATVLYFGLNYYHADSRAAEFTVSGSGVEVTEENDRMVFCPTSPNGTGFIFYPGGSVEYSAYAPLLYELAENGTTCILLKMPLNLAIFDINAADGTESLYPEVNSWYIGGHSLGGVAAAKYVSRNDGAFDGLVLLGAYSSSDIRDSGISVLALYGENDGVMNRKNYEKDKENLPSDFTEIVIPGGNHAYFGSYGNQKGDGTAAITPAQQQEISSGYIEKFISGIL